MYERECVCESLRESACVRERVCFLERLCFRKRNYVRDEWVSMRVRCVREFFM